MSQFFFMTLFALLFINDGFTQEDSVTLAPRNQVCHKTRHLKQISDDLNRYVVVINDLNIFFFLYKDNPLLEESLRDGTLAIQTKKPVFITRHGNTIDKISFVADPGCIDNLGPRNQAKP